MDPNLQLYDEKIRPIERIDFAILGNREISLISAFGKDSAGIEIADLYDNMEPKRGGLIDTRLGITNNNLSCGTCGFDSTNCIGHFGHLDLAEPVFHMGYITYVKKILSCICLKCSKLLVYKNEDELMNLLKGKSGKARFADIKNISKNVTHCVKPGYGCGTPVTKIKIEQKKTSISVNIISELQVSTTEGEGGEGGVATEGKPLKKVIRQILTPEICYDILKNISDSDCMIMGIDPRRSRPEYMIQDISSITCGNQAIS